MEISYIQERSDSLVTLFSSKGVRLHLPQLCSCTQVSWKWESLGPRQHSLQDFIQSCLRGSQEGTDTTWAEAMCFPFSFSLLHPSPESSACRLALQVTGASQDCYQYRAENLLYQSKKLCKFIWPETEINHALHSRRDYWWLSSGWWCEGICASLNPR